MSQEPVCEDKARTPTISKGRGMKSVNALQEKVGYTKREALTAYPEHDVGDETHADEKCQVAIAVPDG